MKEKVTLEDIKNIVNDKELIKNLDYSVLKSNSYLNAFSLFIVFFESIFILFAFFIDISKPVGDYAILKIIAIHLFMVSPIFINMFLSKFFNYKNYCGLTLKIIRKIFYSFNKEDKEILEKLTNSGDFLIHNTPTKMKNILKYYNSLNNKEQKYFLEKAEYISTLKRNIINYIKKNDVETIKKEKDVLTDIVIDNFNNYEIEYISNILINKLKQDKEIKRKMFLNNFNDEEKLEKVNINNKNIIKEI